MKGLIKKDILLTKSLFKSLVIMIIAFIILSVTMQDYSFLTILPMFGVMICMSTLSYDSYYKWDAFALTLPLNRKDCIKAKYLLAFMITIAFALISFLLYIVIGFAQNNPIDLLSLMTSLLGSIISAMIAISFSLPLMYKFGSENGRIIMFIVIIVIGACIIAVSKLFSTIVDQTFLSNTISLITPYLLPIIMIAIIIIIAVSYVLTLKFYSDKEF